MRTAQGPIRHRHDVRLTAAHRFVLAQDWDGEIVAVVIAHNERGELGRVCAPFRIEASDLRALLEGSSADRVWGDIRMRLDEDYVQFTCRGRFAGNATREHWGKVIREFLAALAKPLRESQGNSLGTRAQILR